MQSLTTGLRNKSSSTNINNNGVGVVSSNNTTSSNGTNAAPTSGNFSLATAINNNSNTIGLPITNGTNGLGSTIASSSTNSSNGIQHSNQRLRNNTSSSNTSNEFYPKLITYQIISLQCFYYTILMICYQMNHILYGTSVTLDRIFTDTYVTSFSTGWPDALAILITSFIGSFLLTIIVGKSKKCLDFSCTLFIIHLLFCILYNKGSIPIKSDWWIINITGIIIMILVGEYLCSRRELDDIPLLQI